MIAVVLFFASLLISKNVDADHHAEQRDDINQINKLISQYFQTWQCILIKDAHEKIPQICGDDGEQFWLDWYRNNAAQDIIFDSWTSLEEFLSDDANGYRAALQDWGILNRYESLIFTPGLADIKFSADKKTATAIFGASSLRFDPEELENAQYRERYVIREIGFEKFLVEDDDEEKDDDDDSNKWLFKDSNDKYHTMTTKWKLNFYETLLASELNADL